MLSGLDYTIYFEDCIEGMKKLRSNTVDLIVADPPFGIKFDGKKKGNYNRDSDHVISGYNEIPPEDYPEFTLNWFRQGKRVLKKFGTMYVFSSWNRMIDILTAAKILDLHFHKFLTWSRTFPAYRRWNWVDAFYTLFMFTKYKAPDIGKPMHTFNRIETENPKTGEMRHYPRNDLQFQETYMRGKKKNGTKLPNELVELLILTSSNEGDLVLDPFLGNATTAVEALKAKRRTIGFEINPNARTIIEEAIREVVTK